MFYRLSPYIRYAREIKQKKPWQQSEVVLLDFMLIYVKEGRIKLTIDGIVQDAAPGDIFVLKPGQTYTAKLRSEYGVVVAVHFDLFVRDDTEWLSVPFAERSRLSKQQIDTLCKEAAKAEHEMDLPMRLGVRSTSLVEEYMYGIVSAHKEPMPFGEMRARGQFLMLWSYLLSEHKIVKNAENSELLSRYVKIKDHIKAHYREPSSLEDLAAHFDISPYHLQRMYKRIFGTSPFRYITVLRIKKAKELLENRDIAPAEIAESLGFSSVFAFNRAFCREEGLTPSEYRQSVHRAKEK